MKYFVFNFASAVSIGFAGFLCYSQNQYWFWFLILGFLSIYHPKEKCKCKEAENNG